MRFQSVNPIARRKWLEWIVLIAALAVVGSVFTSVHMAEVKRADAVVRDRLHVLTDIVADDIQSQLGIVNLTLEGVIRDYLSGPDAVQASSDLTRRLNALQIAIPDFRSYSVANAKGIIVATSLPFLLGRNISFRDYFKAARDHPSMNTLYVSSPLQSSRPEFDLIVTVCRILPGPHGEFAGVVVAALSNDFFKNSFLPVGYAPDAWGFVDHGDGQQIMNFPDRKGGDGKDVNQPGSFFSRHLQSGHVVSVMTGTMGATGEQSLVVLRTIQPAALHMDKALIVGLSRKLDVIAQPLHDQAVTYCELYIVIALLCSGGLYWLQRRRAYIETLAADLERERREANERSSINDALRESEARFRTLIEDAPLAIAMLRNGRFIYSNPRYRKLHGYLADDDLTGLPWNAMISPESRAGLHEQETLVNADSPIEQTFEAQGLRKDGHVVPVFKAVTRVDLIDGPATLIFAQDNSAQKHAESAMRQARDAAQAANQSKADFLANMSHEIRSPLNAILGLAYLLEHAHLDLVGHSMVRKIRTSGRMLLGIINDILDVSKIEAGHLLIEQAPFRLDDVIGNVAITMGIAAGDKDIQLIIQPLPAGISSVMGDALRLEQVLNNLTSNAIKFTQSGRVEVGVALLSQREDEIVLRFCVLDTGIGIAPELQSEVFSAFTQADSSTTRRFGGTGLGLTICRQLVGLMGGEIGLSSAPGEGSEFWFTLPMQLIASTDFSSPDMVRIDALIAEDSEIALQALSNTAHGLGWQVSAVRSGEAVLAQLSERGNAKLPDIVILDWKMPGMDGLATARAVRERVPEETCPIIIMASAYSLSSLAGRPGAEIVDAILNKPVTSSTLYNAAIEARRRRGTSVGIGQIVQQEATQGLAGVRLLVVDDSEINRDVAQRILYEQGAIVSLAVDGRAALDWLKAHPNDVDLVLMDVQMPVMDGIEATRQLRLIPQFNSLPVVALTAGAFKAQHDAARTAGMSDFISKPFDVSSTIALIQRLTHKPTDANKETHPLAQTTEIDRVTSELPSDYSVMDTALGLKIWSDSQAYRDYLRRFAGSYSGAVDTINASLEVKDRRAAAALAHKLAGVAANLALPDTHRLALEAERILSTEYDATLALARLQDALTQVSAAIAQFAPDTPAQAELSAPALATNTSPESLADLKTLLIELLIALDSDNPAPVKPILTKLSLALPGQALADIRECVRNFDFRGAETSAIKVALDQGIALEE
jgi:PAS domain S-box-containing protein